MKYINFAFAVGFGTLGVLTLTGTLPTWPIRDVQLIALLAFALASLALATLEKK